MGQILNIPLHTALGAGFVEQEEAEAQSIPGSAHITSLCTPTAQEGTEPQPTQGKELCGAETTQMGLELGMHPAGPHCTETTENQGKSRFGGEAPCKYRFDGETDFCSVLLLKPLSDRSQAQQGENKAKRLL